MSSVGGLGGGAGTNLKSTTGLPDNPVATVRQGETTLAQLATRLNVGLEALKQSNPQLQDINGLKPGQDINLPKGSGPPSISGTDETQGQAQGSNSGAATQGPPQLGDPLLKSMMQLKLNQGTAGPNVPLRDDYVMHADGANNTTLSKTIKGSSSLMSDVGDALDRGANTKGAEKEFAEVKKDIAAGDYTKAFETLKTLMRTQGEDVLTENDVKSTETIRDQLEFLSKMQKAGVKADYPPSETQLVKYFETMKNKPGEARQAFDDYTQNFHVHPVNIKGADFDIKYSQDKVPYGPNKTPYTVDVPKDWSAVNQHPVKDMPEGKNLPQYVGKQMNDCQGYAYMAEKLLGAAGFKLEHHITVFPGPHDAGHSMVIFSHAGEKGYTVTSNDRSFQGDTAKAAAKAGYEYGAGKDNVTGKEHYWVGKTMAEAEIQAAVKNDEL
jgi:LysM domain-containing protein